MELLDKEEIMEFGLIPKLEQFDFNAQQQTQIVNASKELRSVQEESDIKEVIKQENNESVKESKEISKNSSEFASYNEVSLANLNFGFNDASKDFFVKVTRGDIENQYPTDEMMRLKAYLMEENSAS